MSELSEACHWVEDGKQCECIGTRGETRRPIAREEVITPNGIRAKTGVYRRYEVTRDCLCDPHRQRVEKGEKNLARQGGPVQIVSGGLPELGKRGFTRDLWGDTRDP
jgi:hypothetical protein